MTEYPTLAALADDLAQGRTSSRALTEQAFERIKDPSGEGGRAFTKLYEGGALAQADAMDAARANGIRVNPLAGIPISIKDLFDVTGEVTMAGSVVRDDQPAATHDAPIVTRLRKAGAVILGKTNMTEFAFSGIGINPHYDTPRNPWDRETGRIPGGSSAGAAVSVTDGMAALAIGTDTGGSVRIPSAFCGLTGFKPTAKRVPTRGAFPLSTSLDSIGPLGASVACCALIDQIMSGRRSRPISPIPLDGLRLAVPQSWVLDDLDATVAKTFEAAIDRLSKAGARIVGVPFTELMEIPRAHAKGSFAASEAFYFLRDLLATGENRFDPRVSSRIKTGGQMLAADYLELLDARKRIQRECNAVTSAFDAVVMPTTPMVAPVISELVESDDLYYATNMLSLRNCTVGNFLDRCAISLPCHEPGTAPVGLMLMGETMGDEYLLSVAAGVEAALEH
ncbi:MAG: amidase [Rhodospirillaceae bacterium]|nr:amidase [Rhodospirillaceae bacterium]MBT6138173.1 amidase [Rhodospirillaceae bacterium]